MSHFQIRMRLKYIIRRIAFDFMAKSGENVTLHRALDQGARSCGRTGTIFEEKA
jgi:hypothetical protein